MTKYFFQTIKSTIESYIELGGTPYTLRVPTPFSQLGLQLRLPPHPTSTTITVTESKRLYWKGAHNSTAVENVTRTIQKGAYYEN